MSDRKIKEALKAMKYAGIKIPKQPVNGRDALLEIRRKVQIQQK